MPQYYTVMWDGFRLDEYGNGASQKKLHFIESGYPAGLHVRVTEKGSRKTSLYFIFTDLVTTIEIALG
jgi:hypothetical protein